MSDDDLTPFRNDPLLLALRAPADEDELAGEEAALAMFRQSLPARARRRRAITRASVGGASILLTLGLSGGVAAAYTTGLPDPVQDVVHSAIAPLPLPAPPTAHGWHLRRRAAAAAAVVRRRARQEAAKARQTASAGPHPTTRPQAVVPPPRGSARPQQSAGPSATPAPPRPTLTMALSRRVVPVHGQVVVTGRLIRGTESLPGRLVYAAELAAGESTWRRVTSGQTASDGTVSLTVPPLTSNVRLRLVTGSGVTSRQLPVAVVPKLTLSQTRSGNDRAVTVTADGGRPGDGLVLLRRDGDVWTRIGSTALGSDRTGQFVVPGPGTARVRYQVRLPATARHAASFVEFVVPMR